jgi:hypothetical protein
LLQSASAEEIAAAIAAVQLETEAVSESEELAAALRRSFIERAAWKALMGEAGEAHRDFKYVKVRTLMVGAILSPLDQS